MIYGRDAQPYPQYRTPLELQIDQNRGAIKVALQQLRLSRLNIRRQRCREPVEREYIKIMQAHLVALRKHRAELKEELQRWAIFHKHQRAALRYSVNAIDSAR